MLRIASTLVVAVVVGWLGLMGRFHPKYRPFSSQKAWICSIQVILISAVMATFVAFAVPFIPPEVLGTSAGLLAAKSKEERQTGIDTNQAGLLGKARDLISKLLLERLRRRLWHDKEKFITDHAKDVVGLEPQLCKQLTNALESSSEKLAQSTIKIVALKEETILRCQSSLDRLGQNRDGLTENERTRQIHEEMSMIEECRRDLVRFVYESGNDQVFTALWRDEGDSAVHGQHQDTDYRR